ncbi:MAG: DNA primase [Patescibacteria group bacterium]|jgi:DNA primase
MTPAEEIKEKLDLVEFIREFIPVKPAGANFNALCPFHGEKTPSFIISPEKRIWHCFGCGKGGDIFTFLMEMEGLSFKEALRQLAPKAGVVLKNDFVPQDSDKRNRLLDVLALAVKYYEYVLTTPAGVVMRAYLEERGLTPEIIKDWHLGYAPNSWDSLSKFLVTRPQSGKKYTPAELEAAGLAINKDGRTYDRFRDRLMFPFNDLAGNPVGFSGRLNPHSTDQKTGKYINSPQSGIYDKSRLLFGLDKAKQAIKAEDLAIVVEGQMDVIACHQFGLKNTVASSGTALTAAQITLLKRYSKNIALCFDADTAGQLAADRGIGEALAQEMNIRVVVVPNGKDPDESLRHDQEAFKEAVKNAPPMMEYYFGQLVQDLDLNDVTRREEVIEKILPLLALMTNKIEASYWLRRFAERLGVAEAELRAALSVLVNKKTSQSTKLKVEKTPTLILPSREEQLSERLLAIIIKFPELLDYAAANLNPAWLQPSKLSTFYNNLIIYYNKETDFSYQNFRNYLSGAEEEFNLLDRLVLLGDKDFYTNELKEVREELIRVLADLEGAYLKNRLAAVARELTVAEAAGDTEKITVLMEELKYLNQERQRNQNLS